MRLLFSIPFCSLWYSLVLRGHGARAIETTTSSSSLSSADEQPLKQWDSQDETSQRGLPDREDEESITLHWDTRELLTDCPFEDLKHQPFTIDVNIMTEVPLFKCETKEIATVIQKTIFTLGLSGSDSITYGALMCPEPTIDNDEHEGRRYLSARSGHMSSGGQNAKEQGERDENGPTWDNRRSLQGSGSYNWGGGGNCNWCQNDDDDCNTPGCRRDRRLRLGRHRSLLSFEPEGTDSTAIADTQSSVKLIIEAELEAALPGELRRNVGCYENDSTLRVNVVLTAVLSLKSSTLSCLLNDETSVKSGGLK